MPYKYHVRVTSSNPAIDVSLWVGIVMQNKCDPTGNICPNDSELGIAAIKRASELCPEQAEWTCEDWNRDKTATPPVSTSAFFPDNYEQNVKELASLFKPFAERLAELGYRLVIDEYGEYFPTVLPKTAVCCTEGSYSYEHAIAISTPKKVLDSTDYLVDRGDLVSLIGKHPIMALITEEDA